MLKLVRKKKRIEDRDEIYPSANAAFRAAKRYSKIPVSKQPTEVIKKNTARWKEERLDDRNIKLYIFEKIRNLFGTPEEAGIRIRQDKEAIYAENAGKQGPHFNIIANLFGKIKKHFFYKK